MDKFVIPSRFLLICLGVGFLFLWTTIPSKSAQLEQTYPKISEVDFFEAFELGPFAIRNRTVEAPLILKAMRAGLSVTLDNCIIEGDLNFTSNNALGKGLMYEEYLRIIQSQVHGGIRIERPVTPIKTSIYILASEIQGPVVIKQATFMKDLTMMDNVFNGSFDLSATVEGKTDLSRNIFKRHVVIEGRFKKPVILSSSSFEGPTKIQADFDGGIDFSPSTFNNGYFLYLMGTDQVFNIPLRMPVGTATTFKEQVSLVNSTLGDANLANVVFDKNIHIDNVRYRTLNVRWYQISKKLDYNEAFYLSLIKHFRTLQEWDDADDALYEYSVRKREHDSNWFLGSLEMVFLDWSIGYGVKPFRAIVFSLSWITFFSLLFIILHWQTRDAKPPLILMIWLKSLNNFLPGIELPLQSQSFSFSKGKLVLFLLSTERLIGWYTLTMFVIALGRKFIK